MGKLKIMVINALDETAPEASTPKSSSDARALDEPPLVEPCAVCEGPRWPPMGTLPKKFDVIFAILDADTPGARCRPAFRRFGRYVSRCLQCRPAKQSCVYRGPTQPHDPQWYSFFAVMRTLGASLRFTALIPRSNQSYVVVAVALPSHVALPAHLNFAKKLGRYEAFVEGLMATNYYYATLGGASYLIGEHTRVGRGGLLQSRRGFLEHDDRGRHEFISLQA